MLLMIGLSLAGTASMAQGQDYSGNEDPNKKILKQGLLGAGVGAISAEASGGKAGTGALVGAGTNVIGGALLDTLMSPSQPQPQAQQVQYVQQAPMQQQSYSSQQYPVQTQGTVYRQVEQQPFMFSRHRPITSRRRKTRTKRSLSKAFSEPAWEPFPLVLPAARLAKAL